MASVNAVVCEILQAEAMTPSRLQGLLYACQGWNLALTGSPLFAEPIHADPEGPTVRSVRALTQDQEIVTRAGFEKRALATLNPQGLRSLIRSACDADHRDDSWWMASSLSDAAAQAED